MVLKCSSLVGTTSSSRHHRVRAGSVACPQHARMPLPVLVKTAVLSMIEWLRKSGESMLMPTALFQGLTKGRQAPLCRKGLGGRFVVIANQIKKNPRGQQAS